MLEAFRPPTHPHIVKWPSEDFIQTDTAQTQLGTDPGSGEISVLAELVGEENCPPWTLFDRT